jgi:hypothetical protein
MQSMNIKKMLIVFSVTQISCCSASYIFWIFLLGIHLKVLCISKVLFIFI